ncbi:MAG: hypothetical protein IIU39_00510 [Ruminococcus sp.]|nr:hypothetical protein [Ruminococcus sp.]
MRTTKKITSIVLAVLMVVSMMSVMAVTSVSAATSLALGSSTVTITDGGTYVFTGESSASPAVVIATSDAVTIQNSTIKTTINNGRAINITAKPCNLTIDNCDIKAKQRGISFMGDLFNGAVLTVKDSTIINTSVDDYTSKYNASDSRGISLWNLKNTTVNVTNSTIGGFAYDINLTGNEVNNVSTFKNENVKVNLKDSKFYGRAAINNRSNHVTFTIDNCNINGINNQSGTQEGFAAIVSDSMSYNCVFNIKNSTSVCASYDATGLANPNATESFLAVRGENITVNVSDTSYEDNTGKGGIVESYTPNDPSNSVNIESGTFNCTIPEGKEEVVVISGGTFSEEVPVEYLDNSADVSNNVNGTYTVSNSSKTYVARVGSQGYETLEAAIAAAPAGATVKLVADIDYSTTYTERNARDNGRGHNVDLKDLTLDLNGHSISTINASVVFGGNGATIKNGTFKLVPKNTDGSYKEGSYALIIDNKVLGYPNTAEVTVTDVTCEGAVNACGATVELNNVTAKTTPTKFYAIWAEQDAKVTVNSGTYTDDQTGGKGVFATGTGEESGAKIDVKGGTFNATNKIVYNAEANSISISGGSFSKVVPDQYCASGFQPVTTPGTDGKYTVVVKENPLDSLKLASTAVNDGNFFNIDANYLVGTLLGVQKKTEVGVNANDTSYDTTSEGGQETGKDIRLVAVLDSSLVRTAEDYGFVLARANNKTKYSEVNFNNLKANWGNGEKTISAQGTYNNVCGDAKYGDPTDTTTSYKYITCAVNGMSDDDMVVARFYVKLDGKYYYAKYAGHSYTYTGCMTKADLAPVAD